MPIEGYSVSEGAVLPWLMDSGASKHMCNDICMFNALVLHCAEVEFGNGVRVSVYYKGDVTLNSVGGILELSDVLLVPSLATNLFSVSLCFCDDEVYQLSQTCEQLKRSNCSSVWLSWYNSS